MAEIPKIRFKGFTDAWEWRKVGEIAASTCGGGTPSTSNSTYWDGDIPWIQSSDLTEHEVFGVVPKKHISQAGLSNSAARLVPENSLAIITRVGVGKLAVMPFSYTTSQDFLSLSNLHIDIWFGAYALYKKLQGELYSVQGTSIKGITKEELLAKELSVPSAAEQQAIGSFFRHLDHLITLQQRKCDETRELKKYMLQKMFPKNGEKIPEIRFEGYTDVWEQRKLGELVDRVFRKNTNNESSLPLTISAQYGLVDQITYFNNRVASRDVSNYYLVFNGEFAYNKSTSDGFPFGAVKRLDLYEKGVLSTLYIVFSIKNPVEIDSDFLAVFFDTNRWHKGVSERATEGARNHGLLNISAGDFFDIDVCIPKSKAEQTAIGTFICHLDHLITLHQRKLDELKEAKKFLLQNMFPQKG